RDGHVTGVQTCALPILLGAALLGGAAAVVGVVCRRGRSENRLDRRLDRHLVRGLPLGALALLCLSLLYAGWSRPGWRSTGRLPEIGRAAGRDRGGAGRV